jgi:2-oxo-3-hexenedioate decarboxylase
MLDDATCHALAGELAEARRTRRPIEPLTRRHPEMHVGDAYRVMRAGIGLRVAHGEAVCGYKMALTSRPRREQMKLPRAVYGVLTEHMRVEDGGAFHVARCIRPRVEAEIAFVVGREIREPVGREEALASIDSVFAAIEILDSRFRDLEVFSLPDAVADDLGSAYFALSQDARAPGGLDMGRLRLRLSFDGDVRAEADSSALSGDPVESLVQLSELLCSEGQEVPAGSLVLSGAATPALPLAPGVEVKVEVAGLAPVGFRCVE